MAKKQKQKRFREMHDVYGRTIFFSSRMSTKKIILVIVNECREPKTTYVRYFYARIEINPLHGINMRVKNVAYQSNLINMVRRRWKRIINKNGWVIKFPVYFWLWPLCILHDLLINWLHPTRQRVSMGWLITLTFCPFYGYNGLNSLWSAIKRSSFATSF